MGRIFDIQKFSLHDGQGIRTLVFLKGCPLRCRWCSNPESQSADPQLMFSADRCIGETECGGCLSACQLGAIGADNAGSATIDRTKCNNCGDCVDSCPARALELAGRDASVDDVFSKIEQDASFYARSGGGLTISGGEPLLQVDFVVGLLQKARQHGLDTAIETSGACAFSAFETVRPLLDRIYYDIKCLDPGRHEVLTGISNRWILENFANMRKFFPSLDLVVRTPIVPGVNDSSEEIGAIADFILANGGASDYELLCYHAYGESKYRKSGRSYSLEGLSAPDEQHTQRLRAIAGRVRNSDGTCQVASRSIA